MPAVEIALAVDRLRDLVRRAILARLFLACTSDPVWPLSGRTPVDEILVDDTNRGRWRSTWRTGLAEIGAPNAADRARDAVDWLTDES